MKVECPVCGTILGAAHLNVATDVAACPNCSQVFAITSIIAAGHEVDDGFDIWDSPSGTSFRETGTGWSISASTRSASALFLVPFMCVWSGFSLGGIYGAQLANKQFNLGMSLFGIPFVLGTLLFGSIAMMTVCGRVVVSVDRDDGRLFAGVGPIGWTRRFEWSSIRAIEEQWSSTQRAGSNGLEIALVGPSRLRFGGMLSDSRRDYVLRALRRLLSARGHG